MKKLFGWTSKPITWGAVVIGWILSAVAALAGLGYIFGLHTKVADKFKEVKAKIFG